MVLGIIKCSYTEFGKQKEVSQSKKILLIPVFHTFIKAGFHNPCLLKTQGLFVYVHTKVYILPCFAHRSTIDSAFNIPDKVV